MSSTSKSGGASKSKNYYGTVAGAICWGPLDWLTAIIHNGNYLYQGSLTLTTDVTDMTASLLDPSVIAPGGYFKIYRGTETQSADAALAGHPPMKGTAYIAAKDLFFGQDNGTCPNIQIIGGRLPRISTSIVAGADNVADDGQVNPVAALAEILLDERGAGMDISQLDATSWLAAGHYAYANRDYAFCSPLIVQQSNTGDICRQLLEPIGGFLRWGTTGLLECKIYEWGADPGGLQVLDANQWVKKPKFDLGTWEDIPTELLVRFVDRDYEFQANSVLVPNARAAQIRQVDDQQSIDRPDIMRAAQAHRHGTEINRRLGTAPSSAKIKVRNPFVVGLLAGDKIRVDIDPEPGGTGLSQLCRINSIEQDRSDTATIKVTTDNLLPATVYHPVFPAPTPATPVSPPMAHFLAVPLPIDPFGYPLGVAILATRPSAATLGMNVYFSDLHTNPFDLLGQQVGFACRAQLAGSISIGSTILSLTELDGLTGPDASLAANTPGGNATATQNNTLLILLAVLDVNGRVDLDASGNPKMEFVSVSDRSFVSGATFSYTVLRGRLGTPALAWTSGAVAWIFPGDNLFAWHSDLLDTLSGSPAFFRLVSYTMDAEDVTATIPECSVNMLPLQPPGVPTGIAATAYPGYNEVRWVRPTSDGITEYKVYRNTVNNSSAATLIAETTNEFYDDPTGTAGTVYYYFVAAVNIYELTGTKTTEAHCTSTAALGDTAPSNPSAAIKTAQGTYQSSDGTVFASLTIDVPALPAGAKWQNLLYRRTGASEYMIAAQLKNTGTVSVRLDDLSPNVSYDVATQAWSPSQGSSIVTATSSPFTAPSKSGGPSLPSGLAAYAPSSAHPCAPAMWGATQLYSCTVTFADSTDRDIAGYDFCVAGSNVTPPGGPGQLVPVGVGLWQYNTATLVAQYLWVRAYDRTGNVTAYSYTGLNLNLYVSIAAGTMVSQNANSVAITGGSVKAAQNEALHQAGTGAGTWYNNPSNVNKYFWGLDGSITTAFRLYSVDTGGNIIDYDSATGDFSINSNLRYGSYIGTPLSIVGYVPFKTSDGTTRNLAIVN